MKQGDKIYIGSSYSISNGSGDIDGGLAIVKSIKHNERLPEDHCNRTFVEVEGINNSFNLKYLLENQEKWKAEFGDQIAKPAPDIDTPWIEPGDYVNGKIYDGPAIW